MSFDSDTLSAIVPLREAGFAVHWLHPKKKRPIGDDWQKKPVATLDQLRATHSPGNNLGVRLGEYSLTPAGYLHVFDLDIRLPDLADEAWAAFDALNIGPATSFPCVESGSGGESRHVYFVTDKPFYGRKVAVSEGKHRRFDVEKGRDVWSNDWEIELFGTSKQVTMPPSIHPDTGKPYTWLRPFDFDELAFGGGPVIPSTVIEAFGAVETTTYKFEAREPLTFKPGDLESILDDVSDDRIDDYHDWVMLGQALHHQFGGSSEGYDLWVKHSKRSTKFSEKGLLRKYRGFGKSRREPVTMATVKMWVGDERRATAIAGLADEFDDLDEEPAESDDFDELITASPASEDWDGGTVEDAPITWRSLLGLTEEGEVRANLHNLRLIVENDKWTAGVMAFNEFTQEVVQRGQPGVKPPKRKNPAKPVLQLEGASWKLGDPINGDFWTEDKDNAIRALIEAPKTQGGYGIKVPDRDLRAAIDIVARKNGFHPVREYLQALKWDKKPRVETLFIDYLGAPDDPYHRAVARIMMAAAVTRVFEPGAKFDTAVILEGLQGKRKSTFISILAKNWFVEMDCDVTDTKAVVELLQGAWLVEMNELGGFTKADVRHVKAFISRRSDKVRLAYAKRAQEYHRQSILVGSTNDDVYLRDPSGGRRFMPVRCQTAGEIDTDRLLLEVDQLWAEARIIYEQMRVAQPRGTLPLYLTGSEARKIAERLQESRQVETSEDALAGRIAEWLEKPITSGSIDDDLDGNGKPVVRNQVCLIEIWCDCLGRDEGQYIGAWPTTLGRAMRLVPGWKETARRSRFGRHGQQRGFQRDGWIAAALLPKQPGA